MSKIARMLMTGLLGGMEGSLRTPATIPALEHINAFPSLHWSAAGPSADSNTYLYGYADADETRLLKKVEGAAGQSYTQKALVTSVNPTFVIRRVYSTNTNDLIFVEVRDTSNYVYHLLRSVDGGTTLTDVLTFGAGNGAGGTDTDRVRILNGFCELKRNLPGGTGQGTLLIGEYNYRSANTPGAANDRVRLLKSTDGGATWTKVTYFNTNGSTENIRHIHAVKQDPYTGHVYVCTGDGDAMCAIIRWDGVSAWPDNTSVSSMGALPGFNCINGKQRHRTVDLVFTADWFFTFTDVSLNGSPDGAEMGIWRGAKDLSAYTQVYTDGFAYDPMHAGWFGENINGQLVITTSRQYIAPSGWTQLNTRVYSSPDCGANWYPTGSIGLVDSSDPTSDSYQVFTFQANGRLYMDHYDGSGYGSTDSYAFSASFVPGSDPIILHPVYYAGAWNTAGNDANAGQTPDAPAATLKKLMENNNICVGARVRLSAATFPEANIYPQWSGATKQGRGSTIIEGQGRANTHVYRTTSVTSAYLFAIENVRTGATKALPLLFKNIHIYNPNPQGTAYVLDIFSGGVKLQNVQMGDTTNDTGMLARTGDAAHSGDLAIYNSLIIPNVNADYVFTFGTFGSNSIEAYNCLVVGGKNVIYNRYAGTSTTVKFCTFYGYATRAINVVAGSTVAPIAKNCIFVGLAGSKPIGDSAILEETEVDYNLYNIANVAVTDGGHSLAVGIDPLFVNPGANDFHLQRSSPCKRAGISVSGLLTDVDGHVRPEPPSIGAYDVR